MSALARVETEQRGSRCIVTIRGEIDLSNAKEISSAIEAAVPRDALELVVDLSPTTYIDSAGVSLLLRLSERMQARRQPLQVLTPPGSPVRAVLELTGLPRVMTLLTSLDPS